MQYYWNRFQTYLRKKLV